MADKLHIVHVIDPAGPDASGRSTLVRGLADALDRHGCRCVVVASDPAGGRARLGLDPPSGPPEELLASAQVVHLHGYSPALRRWAEAARRLGRQLVISPGGDLGPRRFDRPGWTERLRRWWRDPGLLRSATLLAQNEVELEALGGRPARVEVLSYGIDFPSDSAAPPDVCRPLLLVLGPIHPAWGIVPLLKALAELEARASDWRVVLAGPDSGPWKRMIQAAVHRKHAAERVRFVEPDEVETGALLREAALVVAPAVEPVAPFAVLRGLSAGLCVLASPCAIPADAASLVQCCEPRRTALRQVLVDLLSVAPAALRARGWRVRSAARDRLAWDRLVPRYLACYRG